MQPTTLFVICGLPGSGKTTLAKQFEASRRAYRMSADDWMDALSINLDASDARAKIETLQWSVTRRLLALGQSVIVEWGTWGKWERDTLRKEARALGVRVELHTLSASPEELFARIQARAMEDPPIEWTDVQKWGAIFETPTPEETALFDPPLEHATGFDGDRDNPSFHLRSFVPSDLETLQRIRARAFHPIFESFRRSLGETIFNMQNPNADQKQADELRSLCEDQSSNEVFVLTHNDSTVGFVSISVEKGNPSQGSIGLNAVDPEFQGRGAGAMMYTFALNKLKERGVRLAGVGTGLDSAHEPARKAYERAGFSASISYVAMFQLL